MCWWRCVDVVCYNTHHMQIKKADGTIENFDEKKLIRALTKSGAQYLVAKEISDYVLAKCEQTGHNEIVKSEHVYHLAFKQLKNISRRSALKFSLKKAMLELGPSGFPFEEFVAEMWRARGYTAITGQMVFGTCVAHEVDVIAWKDDELVMIEAKYHSDSGSRTDLKTVLYVKARYDDIQKQTFSTSSFNAKDVVGKSLKDMHTFEKSAQNIPLDQIKMPKQLTEGWLITNTHFSDTAITYANCNNLKIMSYDYPENGSLQDIVIEHRLFPITCLTTITMAEKKELISKNIVLCKTLHERSAELENLGFSKEKIFTVLEEVASLL